MSVLVSSVVYLWPRARLQCHRSPLCCSDPELPGSLHMGAKGQVCSWMTVPACTCVFLPEPMWRAQGAADLQPHGSHTLLSFSLFRQIEQLLELLTTEILNPDSQAPSGVKSHFLEIFLEELAKVGAAEVRWARVRAVAYGACVQHLNTLPISWFPHSSPQTKICSSSTPSAR